MYIETEFYYEDVLKGKSEKEIRKEIRRLKKEIGELRNAAESTEPVVCGGIDPEGSPEEKLSKLRVCLDLAKKAYAQAGGVYIPTQAEQKAAEFDESLAGLKRLTYSESGFLGAKEIVYTICDDQVLIETSSIFDNENTEKPQYKPRSKDEFIKGLEALHMSEWKRRYVYPYVTDGGQWELLIEYFDDHKPVKYYGYAISPYNYKELRHLLNVKNPQTGEFFFRV